jgi:hypothetical protein
VDHDTRFDEFSKIVWRWRSGQLSRRTVLRLLASLGVSLGGGLATIQTTRGMDHHPGHFDNGGAGPIADETKIVNTDVVTGLGRDLNPLLKNPERGMYFGCVFRRVGEEVPAVEAKYYCPPDEDENDYSTIVAWWLWLAPVCGDTLTWDGPDSLNTSPVLSNYAKDLEFFRRKGYKVLFRPRYDRLVEDAEGDQCNVPSTCLFNNVGEPVFHAASRDLQKNHIEEVAAMLAEYKDVIAFIQAGYLGNWGEWNTERSSDCAQSYTEANAPMLYCCTDRLEIIDHIVSTYAAAGITQDVEFRTPVFANEALAGNASANIGLHNDCFMSSNLTSSSDSGTYSDFFRCNPGDCEGLEPCDSPQPCESGARGGSLRNFLSSAASRAWAEVETANFSFGGETCASDGNERWRICDNMTDATGDPTKLHLVYLNAEHHRDSVPTWELGDTDLDTCYDEIRSALGYRFEVTTVEYTKTVTLGQNFLVRVYLTNTGWAKLHKPRQAWLLLRNGSTVLPPYEFSSGDVASWAPGQPMTISVNAPAPSVGEYEVRLWIPDPDAVIRDGEGNPIPEVPVPVDDQSADQKSRIAYSVKLATLRNGSSVFVPTSGENYLGAKIEVVEPQPVDSEPPVISGVNVTITNATTTSYSAIIGWSTSELADSQVEYGPSPNLGTFAPPDPDLTTAHFVRLDGLDPDFPVYHFEVRSRDAAGNLATDYGNFSPPPFPG